MKKYFRRSTDFKLLRQMKGNWANNCEIFLKFIIFSGAAIAIARPGHPKNLATALLVLW
jgi:hypothetical protein